VIDGAVPDAWLGHAEIRRLANGLTVAVLEDRSAPVVSTALWYRAGAAHEPVGAAGMAHFLEHMMFKGSADWPEGEIDARTQAVGGVNNAYTSHDSTVYVFSLPRRHWRLALEIEADRMTGLVLDPAAVDSERDVIFEEISEADDSPWDALEMAAMERLYGEHPYGRRILGSHQSLSSIGADQLATFHGVACAPARAVLTVSGDVGSEVFEAVDELFADLPAREGELPEDLPTRGRSGAARVELSLGRTRRGLQIFAAPSARTQEFVALRLALTALCGGRSSRLQRRLVDEGRLCQSVSSSVSETVEGGAAVLSFEALPQVSEESIEEVIEEVLTADLSTALNSESVERARRMLLSDWLFSHETIELRGATLGAGLALFGDDYTRRQYEWLRETTVEEIVEVARGCLTTDDRIVAWTGSA